MGNTIQSNLGDTGELSVDVCKNDSFANGLTKGK